MGLRLLFVRQTIKILLHSGAQKSNSGSSQPRPHGGFGAVVEGDRSGMKFRSNQSIRIHRCRSGQALIESAIIIPFVLMIIFNAINYGYFFYVAQNMSAATRSGALYSILGGATPGLLTLPSPGASSSDITGVANVVYQDLLGALPSSGNAVVRVCSLTAGTPTGTGASTITACTTLDPAGLGPTFPAVTPDPEAPTFLLNRIEISYSFSPIIPGAPFGAILLAGSNCSLVSGSVTCTFSSHVMMREMN